jgi:hypothetical protein
MREYTLRKQLGNRGVYASIAFDTTVEYEKETGLEFAYQADLKWRTACEAGVLIFFDYFTRLKQGHLTVRVINIKWLPVDTNHLAIVFATVKGLCEAVDINPMLLGLDEQTETFRFPECRISIAEGIK